MSTSDDFDIADRIAVVTGATGVLGGALSRALAAAGVRVAVVSRSRDRSEAAAERIGGDGGRAIACRADVLDRASIDALVHRVIQQWGRIDILVNAAGGNRPAATTAPERSFFDLSETALREVMELNWLGTLIPCQAVGLVMARQQSGVVLNVSSLAADRPLTRVVGYGGAKAGLNHFTRWLAVYVAREISPAIRVNAIAPGFFETEQNRFLLRDPDSGELSARARTILEHTPMGRFGEPVELVGTMRWLVSDAARFVTGVTVPVDGGFSAYAGV